MDRLTKESPSRTDSQQCGTICQGSEFPTLCRLRARTGQESPESVNSPAAMLEGPGAWPKSPESVQSPDNAPASPVEIANHLARIVGTITTVRPGQQEHATPPNNDVGLHMPEPPMLEQDAPTPNAEAGATMMGPVLVEHAVRAGLRALNNWRHLFRGGEPSAWMSSRTGWSARSLLRSSLTAPLLRSRTAPLDHCWPTSRPKKARPGQIPARL